MDVKTKECPSCKRQIQADANFCLYCGARFAVTYQGYCANCHTIRALNIANRCAVCGGEVIDLQPAGQEAGPLTLRPSTPVELPAAKKAAPGCLNQVRGCLVLFVIGLGLLLAAYYLSADFRDRLLSLGDLEIASPAPTEDAAPQTPSTAEILPTATLSPTRTPVIELPAIPPDAACVGEFDTGLSCLSAGAWISISRSELPYTGHLSDLAQCPGRIYLLVSDVLYGYSGGQWTKYGQYGGTSSGVIGCGVRDDVWIFDNESAFHFENAAWSEYVYETVLNGTGYLSANAVQITPDNQVWLVANENVVHYDGTAWTVFENKQDLQTDYRLTGLAVDQNGVPWVTYLDGLSSYNGSAWTKIAPPASSDVNTVYIDPLDQLWVGTDGGVSMYQNGNWQRYPIGRLAGSVTSLKMDARQRLWVGTDWGLGILEKGQYTFYHMSNTDMLVNDIRKLIVLGDGPALPEKVEKDSGSLAGRLINGAQPLANARVEVCVQSINMFFSGATPCSGQPYLSVTTSDAEGNFKLEGLPVGYYIVTFQIPDGKWKVRSNAIGVGSVFLPVRAGEVNDLGNLDISQD